VPYGTLGEILLSFGVDISLYHGLIMKDYLKQKITKENLIFHIK
jgi:hypothetical protein